MFRKTLEIVNLTTKDREDRDEKRKHLPCSIPIKAIVNECYPRIYIGPALSVMDPTFVLTNKFTHILDMSNGLCDTVNHPGVEYLRVRVEDVPNANLLGAFPDLVRWIEKALEAPEAKLLVHCIAGVSRSVSAVAAYIIYKEHKNVDFCYLDALAIIRTSRKVARPNQGFVCQLEDFEVDLKQGITYI